LMVKRYVERLWRGGPFLVVIAFGVACVRVLVALGLALWLALPVGMAAMTMVILVPSPIRTRVRDAFNTAVLNGHSTTVGR